MLHVQTAVKPSHISGFGLFAVDDIPVGAVVSSWEPGFDVEVPDSSSGELGPADLDRASREDGVFYLAGDGMAYANHSGSPNVRTVPGPGPRAKLARVAARDVRRGEELTMDYGEVGDDAPYVPPVGLQELRNILRDLATEVLDEAKEKNQKVNPAYLKGVGGKARSQRKKEIQSRAKEPHDDPRSYRPFKTDKDPRTGQPRKTKPSKWNKEFQRMFGEGPGYTDQELAEAEADLADDSRWPVDLESLEGDDLLEEYLYEARLLSEKRAGKKSSVTTALKNKAKKANAPMGALRAIYNKGLAAWRTGHRPGASRAAWAMARVNSVLAGGPARKVDAAQWEQIKKFRARRRR